MKRLFWILFAVTMAVYATIVGWSLPHISAAAGDLVPFDMRPGGYSFEDARAFLAALSPDGAAFYEAVQHRLDIFYPPLIALTLAWAIAALLPRGWGIWCWAIGALAMPIAALDYLENAAVSVMLQAGAAGLTPEMVASASGWTIAKSMLTTVAMSLVLLLLLVRLTFRIAGRLRHSASA
jgi:hypothetical protein